MNFLTKKSALIHVGALLACLPSQDALAKKNLAELAAQSVAGVASVSTLTIANDKARAKVDNLSSARPDDVAFVHFALGVAADSRGLELLAQKYGLDVSRVQALVEVGSAERVFTVDIGGTDLLSLDGSLSERIEKVYGHIRLDMIKRAHHASGQEKADLKQLVTAKLQIFSVEAYAASNDLRRLARSPAITAMTIDESVAPTKKSRDHLSKQIDAIKVGFAAEAKALRANQLPRASGQNSATTQASVAATTNSITNCEWIDTGGYICWEEPPDPPSFTTGNPEIDAAILSQPGTVYVTGTSTAADDYVQHRTIKPWTPAP